MRIIKIFICMLFIFSSIASAEVYLLVDKETQEIKSLSNEDDAQVESGQEKIILDMDIMDIELAEHPRYYKYKNDRFVMNIKKLSDETIVANEREEEKAELDMIMERVIKNAKTELEAEGKVFKHKHTKD